MLDHVRNRRFHPVAGVVLAFVFALFLAGAAFADEKSADVPPGAQRCFGFVWAGAHGRSHSRSGIMVPITINDQHAYMQLDTGAPRTVLYGRVTDRTGLTDPTRDTFLPNKLCSGSYCWTPSALRIDRRKFVSSPKILGHLGLDVLQGQETLLDYPAQRICALGGDEQALKITWSPAVVSKGSFLISGIVGTAHLDRLLFDTGSAPFTVQVFPAVWDVLPSVSTTGGPGLPDVEGHAYDGTLLHVQSKLITGTVIIGAKPLTSPVVYELPENLQPIVSRRGAAGIVGDAAFLDQQVILDMRDPARFGVINSAQHPAE
ncbi:hypothetical protein [Neoasaia chiangmaiensis]|uniref:hypothetical protein n=1 Tax=Neoasaia chiangmaiensis TaxID=320497 RepID=UPI0011BEF38F|nr:hypothetical protein [Neoasaia chiangmaiensis]